MTSLILGLRAIAAAAFAVYNAIATTRYTRQTAHYARQAQAANRETWGIRNETQRRQLKREQRR
jgi:hypothetical protein